VFFLGLTWVFNRDRSNQSFLYFFLNLNQFRPQVKLLNQSWFYNYGYCSIINFNIQYKLKWVCVCMYVCIYVCMYNYFLKHISLTTTHIKSKIYIFIFFFVHCNKEGYKNNHFILYLSTKHNFIFIFFSVLSSLFYCFYLFYSRKCYYNGQYDIDKKIPIYLVIKNFSHF